MDILAPLSGESTLEIVLDNREARVMRQRALLEKHRMPLVSFTVNMPGPVKDNTAARIVFAEGMRLLDERIRSCGWTVQERTVTEGPAGPECVVAVNADAVAVKKHTVVLEDETPLGRLFDMDVLDMAGESLSRTELGFAPRACLLCASPAKECGRSRKHGLEAVLERIREIVAPYSAAGL